MAADTVATLDSLIIPERSPKILRIYDGNKDEYMIGCVGSTRVSQIIKYHMVIDPRMEIGGPCASPYHTDTMGHMVRTFIPALRAAFAKAGYANSSAILVGAAGRLFSVMDDCQVSESSCGYDAIGSINAIAIVLGSLYTTTYNNLMCPVLPHNRVRYALNAVVTHEMNCGGHVIVKEHEYVHDSSS